MNSKHIAYDTRFLDLQIQEEKELYAETHKDSWWQVPGIDTSVVFLSGAVHLQRIFQQYAVKDETTEGFQRITANDGLGSWLEDDFLEDKTVAPLFEYLEQRDHMHRLLLGLKQKYPSIFKHFVSISFGIGGINFTPQGCFVPTTGADRIYIAVDRYFNQQTKRIDESWLSETIMTLLQSSVNHSRYHEELTALADISISYEQNSDDPILQARPLYAIDNAAELLDAYCAELTGYDYLLHNQRLRLTHHQHIVNRLKDIRSVISGFERVSIYYPEVRQTAIAQRIQFLVNRIQYKTERNYPVWIAMLDAERRLR